MTVVVLKGRRKKVMEYEQALQLQHIVIQDNVLKSGSVILMPDGWFQDKKTFERNPRYRLVTLTKDFEMDTK